VTPLLVVQGKNDPRVNIRESNQIVAAVRDNGKPVEYLVAPDEGHGFARPINSLALVTAMEKILCAVPGRPVSDRRNAGGHGQAQGNHRRPKDSEWSDYTDGRFGDATAVTK